MVATGCAELFRLRVASAPRFAGPGRRGAGEQNLLGVSIQMPTPTDGGEIEIDAALSAFGQQCLTATEHARHRYSRGARVI
jgi:hypothetical protein